MKHSILFVVSKPTESKYEYEDTWQKCVYALSDFASNNTNYKLIAENCLLLPLNESLNPLADLVNKCTCFGYKYAILTEELEWYELAKSS